MSARRSPDRLHGIRILFEDSDLLVVDKPAGLLTTHTKVVGRIARESQLTADNVLTDYLRKGQWKSSKRAWLVHRLDRETSGVMMFAKSREIAERLREHWNETTEKTYLARVEGELTESSGVFESWLRENDDGFRVRSVRPGSPGARLAKTAWRVVEEPAGSAGAFGQLVEVKLHSGRKNQIRVHFSEAGHPIVGDVKYGAKKARRMCLHAWKLAFVHPTTRRRLAFSSPCEFADEQECP